MNYNKNSNFTKKNKGRIINLIRVLLPCYLFLNMKSAYNRAFWLKGNKVTGNIENTYIYRDIVVVNIFNVWIQVPNPIRVMNSKCYCYLYIYIYIFVVYKYI
jgi:hypothetical protein